MPVLEEDLRNLNVVCSSANSSADIQSGPSQVRASATSFTEYRGLFAWEKVFGT